MTREILPDSFKIVDSRKSGPGLRYIFPWILLDNESR